MPGRGSVGQCHVHEKPRQPASAWIGAAQAPYSNDLKEFKMLTLAEAKLHLRVDHDDEDALIQSLIEAACDAVAHHLNKQPTDLFFSIEPSLRAAALLLVGDLYQNREAQAGSALHANPTYARLLAPYRVY